MYSIPDSLHKNCSMETCRNRKWCNHNDLPSKDKLKRIHNHNFHRKIDLIECPQLCLQHHHKCIGHRGHHYNRRRLECLLPHNMLIEKKACKHHEDQLD